MTILLHLLGGINLLGFTLMGLDKAKAKLNQWRIREGTLLGIAVAFGSFGVYLGLMVFHHKTHHKTFTITLPVLMVIQAGVLLWLYTYL